MKTIPEVNARVRQNVDREIARYQQAKAHALQKLKTANLKVDAFERRIMARMIREGFNDAVRELRTFPKEFE